MQTALMDSCIIPLLAVNLPIVRQAVVTQRLRRWATSMGAWLVAATMCVGLAQNAVAASSDMSTNPAGSLRNLCKLADGDKTALGPELRGVRQPVERRYLRAA